jgi:RHS repeat-associated protein
MKKLSFLKARALASLLALGSSLLLSAQAQGNVSPPNGTHSQQVVDLVVHSSLGAVEWKRVFNGSGWRFNRHWDGINASFKPVTVQNTGGGAPRLGAGDSGGGAAVCWIWVDEDWQPGDGSPLERVTPQQPRAIGPGEYIPPNNAYNQTAAPLDTALSSFFSACASSGGNITGGNGSDITQVFEGFRRQSQLYVGSGGTYIFKNRNVLKKLAIQRLPATSGEPNATPASFGSLVSVANGWRWSDRGGDWAEYDDTGRITRYGDRNNNTIWIQRNANGQISRIIDAGQAGNATSSSSAATGRVLITLHYNAGGYLVQAKDHPFADVAGDNPQRSVSYQYDSLGRMTSTTDTRGKTSQYGYDFKARLTSSTDPLGRATTMVYEDENNSVKQMTAADGGVSDYSFSYDDSKKTFYSKMQGPVNNSSGTAVRRTEEYTHDRAGDLIRYEVNGRAELAVTRDPVARTESRTNARGFTTVLTKNEFEQVTQVQHPDGARQSTQYEARWLNPIEMVDELGFKTIYGYDSNGNLIKKTEAQGTPDERVTEYELNAAGWPLKFTRKGRTEANGQITPDAVWQVEYDSAGQIKKTTDPEGHIRQYQFNRFGQLLKYTDPRGGITQYEVDAQGNLIKEINPLGNIRNFSYDSVGNLIGEVDARGKSTVTTFDSMNRQKMRTNAIGGQHTSEYDKQGSLISEKDEDGRSTRLEYDNFQRLIKQVDALNNVTQFDYQISDGSSAGQLGSLDEAVQIKYPTFSQQNRFDARERPASQTIKYRNSLGEQSITNSTSYNQRGDVTSETDPYGNTRNFLYNAFGQRVEVTDSLSGKTTYRFDARGNLLLLTDANGNTHRYEYDRNDQLIKETRPMGQVIQFQYDEAGNLVKRVEPNGNQYLYTLDAANRIVKLDHKRTDGLLLRSITQAWDANNNLTAWSDTDALQNQSSGAVLTYDDANRKTSEAVTYPSGYTLNYSYTYSLAGKKTRLTWPDGTQIDYAYSAHGELDSVNIPGEGMISVSEYNWNTPKKTTLPGGSGQERAFDGLLNLESLSVKTPGQQSTLSLSNRFGKKQEIKSRIRTDNAGNNASTTLSEQFSYDTDQRLTSVQRDSGGVFGLNSESYTLDAVANRIASSKINGNWQYDANNRLTQIGGGACGALNVVCYQWDVNSNLTHKIEPNNKHTIYRYDSHNRLNEVALNANGIEQLIARYGYDPMDRRLWKEQYRDKAGQPLPQALRTYYLYSDEGLIAEAIQHIVLNANKSVSSSGQAEISTQYGSKPDSEFTTGILFVKTRASNGQSLFAYYHHDHLNTPIQATDKSGHVVWVASYEPFGKAIVTTPAPTVDKPTISSNLRLPGQYLDEETGLHYNFRRYYDPETGRYITSDPIGLEGGLNLHLYALANPTTYSDPRGENAVKVIVQAVTAAIAAIKKCAGDKACKCKAVYASYKAACGLPRSCEKITKCDDPSLDIKEKTSRYCYQLRDLYIRMDCDRAIPTTVNHPGERDSARDVWKKCKAKQENCKNNGCV